MGHFNELPEFSLNLTFFLSIFSAGILGSAHCAGMCGPLAHLVSKNRLQNATYNIGRLFGYLAIGILFGYLGHVIREKDWLWFRYGGSFLVLLFVGYSCWSILKRKSLGITLPQFIARPVFKYAKFSGSYGSAFTLGFLTLFLPCGWLMSFAGVSAASGSVEGGALVMLAFWLSTLPVMSVVPLAGRKVLTPLIGRYPTLAATLLGLSAIAVMGLRFLEKHSCH